MSFIEWAVVAIVVVMIFERWAKVVTDRARAEAEQLRHDEVMAVLNRIARGLPKA